LQLDQSSDITIPGARTITLKIQTFKQREVNSSFDTKLKSEPKAASKKKAASSLTLFGLTRRLKLLSTACPFDCNSYKDLVDNHVVCD
jgi:hypothetical protein